MNNALSNFAQPDNRPERTIIRERIEMIAAVFSKKISEEMILVFQSALERYPNEVLKRAFGKAETELERFPTPKAMRDYCNADMPSRGWAYDFVHSRDPEGIPCLLDPDPNCEHCRDPRSFHPTKTCDNFEGSIYMYKPEDCAEGRMYLAAVKAVSKMNVMKAEKKPYSVYNESRFSQNSGMVSYRRWIAEEVTKDNLSNRLGQTKLPRSKEEQAAIDMERERRKQQE